MSPVDTRLHLTFAAMGSPFIELRRFDEAIAAGKQALRQNPSHSGIYRCLASAFAHLGRDAEARDAAAHLFQLDPSFTISAWIARGGQSNAKLLIERVCERVLATTLVPERTAIVSALSQS